MHFPNRTQNTPGVFHDRTAWFHLSIRTHPEVGRLSLTLAQMVWATTLEEVALGRVEVGAACLMLDHIHLLIRPQEMDITRWLNSWKSITTRRAWVHGHHGALWQPKMWDRTIRTTDQFEQVVEYIRSNPVAAGLCNESSEWAYLFVGPE